MVVPQKYGRNERFLKTTMSCFHIQNLASCRVFCVMNIYRYITFRMKKQIEKHIHAVRFDYNNHS